MSKLEKIDCLGNVATRINEVQISCDVAIPSDSWGLYWQAAAAIATFCAVAVALYQTRKANRAAEKAIGVAERANDLADKALTQSFKAAQAQLDMARKASQEDLEERRNSRELDITAGLVTALDEMQLAVGRNPMDPARGEALMASAMNCFAAFSRFDLFVGQSGALVKVLHWLVDAQSDFEPQSIKDFESKEFERMVLVQVYLRINVANFQKERQLTEDFPILQAALTTGDLALADGILASVQQTD